MDLSAFYFGFLAGDVTRPPKHFLKVRPDLFIHPTTKVAIATNEECDVVLVGRCVDPLEPAATESEISRRLLKALSASEQVFHEAGDHLCGRYAILYTRGGVRKIVTDAVGLRSAFYDEQAKVVGSHALLVAQQKGPTSPVRQRFKMGFPGRRTPYQGVYLLTPNTSLTLVENAIERIFPREMIAAAPVGDVVDIVVPLVNSALSVMNERGERLLFSVTAGLDSRTTIAAAQGIAGKSTGFTYGNVKDERRYRPSLVADEAIGPEVAHAIGMKHVLLERSGPSEAVSCVLKMNSYHPAGGDTVEPLIKNFGQHTMVHVRSNILEIGRAYFRKYGHDLSSPEGNIGIYGLLNELTGEQKEFVLESFVELYELASIPSAFEKGWCPFDVLYWEHRMGAWMAQHVLNDDIAFETFIPWNSRLVLMSLLRPPIEDRAAGAVASTIVSRSGLDRWPINPRMGKRIRQSVAKVAGGADGL